MQPVENGKRRGAVTRREWLSGALKGGNMARLTPKDILDISEPVEAIYQRTVDELLINIAHHFKITGWERTRYWEIKKLSESFSRKEI